MHRIDSDDATPDHLFTEGDPTVPVDATTVTAEWLNAVQEEIVNVILAAGIALDKTKRNQLRDAIAELIAAQAVTVPAATTTQAGIARRATAAEVLAGEATTPYVCPADLMAALLAGLAGVARLGAVGAYTRQHYAVPVVLTGQGGDVQLDAELHQDVDITASGALNMLAPLHPARGMYLTITLRAASALAITWAAAFAPNKDVALPTAFVAGKALVLQFRCMDGVNWMLIGKAEGA